MKKLTIFLIAMFAASAYAQVSVQPHYRKDGTYVEGYTRSAPNHTRTDNYSSQGNTNPYTGQQGTIDPYSQPTPSYQTQPRQSNHGQQCGQTASGQYVCR